MRVTTDYVDLAGYPDTKESSGLIVFDERWMTAEVMEIKDGRISETNEIQQMHV
jgi:hypothetical protein